MDRARDFHFVNQLPRKTVPNVDYQEQVHDRQVDLNETWVAYCRRRGYAAEREAEDRVKWVTESWPEYEARVPLRAAALDTYFANEDAKRLADEAAAAERLAVSNKVIAMVAEHERNLEAARLPLLHTLNVDFEEKLLQQQREDRRLAEEEEEKARAANVAEEIAARKEFEALADASLTAVLALLEERRRAAEDEAARIRAEQDRIAEEKRQEEERKRREAEEAERKRREAEEEAKRAERRRRDDERKAKARAEREARAAKQRAPAAAATVDHGALRSAARDKRIEHMKADMDDYLHVLQERAAAVQNTAGLNDLMKAVVGELGGKLLFHTAVYIATAAKDQPEPGQTTLTYVYASANCSDKLKSSTVTLNSAADSGCPTVAKVLLQSDTVFVPKCSQDPSVKNIGGHDRIGDGDFLTCPIVAAEGDVYAVFSTDTLSTNPQDAAATLKDDETNVYSADAKDGFPTVSMGADQRNFTEAVSHILSGVAKRVTVDDGSTAATGTGNMDLGAPTSLAGLFTAITEKSRGSLRDGKSAGVYVARQFAADGTACVVVSHNGRYVGALQQPDDTTPTHLLAKTLEKPNALSFALKGKTHEYVADVSTDDRCVAYIDSTPKAANECLLLIPLRDRVGKQVAVIGVYNDGGLTDEEIQQLLAMARQAQALLLPLLLRQEQAELCNQALDWLHLVTGCQDVYVSLKDSVCQGNAPQADDALEYVAASSTQRWLLGKRLAKADGGVSHGVMSSADAALVVPDVAKHEAIKLWDDALKTPEGALLCAPIRKTATDASLGVIYADTVKNKKHNGSAAFTDADKTMIALTAKLLAECFDFTGDASENGTTLSVEAVAGEERIRFLKRVWMKANHDISGLTKDQLLEMAKYNSPPVTIVTACGATMLVGLGAKPTSVEKWEDIRKKIKQALLDKIKAFDPTATKRKKAFFIRAKKMTKGLTAEEVFSKGSYPASCFFTWLFVTIQLRYASDLLRKLIAAGSLDGVGSGDDAKTTATDVTDGALEGEEEDLGAEAGEDLPSDGEKETES